MGDTSDKIVIVEDDPVYLESLRSLIEYDSPYDCVAFFTNSHDMLEYFESESDIDLVLADIGLPDISGVEAMQKIKSVNPEIKFIMLTVFDDNEKVFDALRMGASGYLLKAESDDKVIQSINDVMAGGVFFTPSIAVKVLDFFSKKTKDNYNLTRREIEILRCLVEGCSKKMIADKLFISFSTADTHTKNIYRKLHVHSGIEAVVKAIKEELI